MRKSLLIALSCAVLLPLGRFQAYAQPQETFAEIRKAAALLQTSESFRAATMGDERLLAKRRAMNDTRVIEALALVRDFARRSLAPLAPLDLTANIAQEILSPARACARALLVRQTYLLSEGKTSLAIDTLRESLHLAYALEGHGAMGYLTGLSIEAMMMQGLAPHLEQFSLQDCARISALAQDWQKSPSLLGSAFLREQNALLEVLKKRTGNGANASAKIAEKLPTLAKSLLRRHALPYGDRDFPVTPESEEDAEGTLNGFAATFRSASDKTLERLALARMLGCHAAILRYKWEQRRLPASLQELSLGDQALDPFTGVAFVYRIEQKNYVLESAGGFAPSKNGDVDRSQRRAFRLQGAPAKKTP